jgi:hypothetical protein
MKLPTDDISASLHQSQKVVGRKDCLAATKEEAELVIRQQHFASEFGKCKARNYSKKNSTKNAFPSTSPMFHFAGG